MSIEKFERDGLMRLLLPTQERKMTKVVGWQLQITG
jgi:hypothetical protein